MYTALKIWDRQWWGNWGGLITCILGAYGNWHKNIYWGTGSVSGQLFNQLHNGKEIVSGQWDYKCLARIFFLREVTSFESDRLRLFLLIFSRSFLRQISPLFCLELGRVKQFLAPCSSSAVKLLTEGVGFQSRAVRPVMKTNRHTNHLFTYFFTLSLSHTHTLINFLINWSHFNKWRRWPIPVAKISPVWLNLFTWICQWKPMS